MVGRWLSELPSGPPCGVIVIGPYRLVTVQVAGVAVPTFTVGSVTVSGETVTPWTLAVSANGLLSTGEVRRDSTSSSQTPGIGLSYDRSSGLHVAGSE